MVKACETGTLSSGFKISSGLLLKWLLNRTLNLVLRGTEMTK